MSGRTLAEILIELGSAERSLQLIAAATDSRAALDAAVDGQDTAPSAVTEEAEASPSVYLSSVEVEGFRGIGPSSSLLLTPGPGLTLVVGRNGSGKSSFAEGLEMLMTGSNLRWENRTLQWKSGWRNLHHGDSTMVKAAFAVEGRSAPVEASRSWGAADAMEASTTNVADPAGAWTSFDAAGWASPLETHRPFLSYNELGPMLEERPADLYDAMAAFLGLDDLLIGQDNLRQARLEHEKPAKEAKNSAKQVLGKLEESEDPRAGEATALMRARTLDVAALRELVDSASGSDDDLNRLRSIANLSTPDESALQDAASALEAAVSSATDAAGTAAGRAERLERLLHVAHEHIADADTETCPVCGTNDVLNDDWRQRTKDQLAMLKQEAVAASAASSRLDAARRDARTAIVSPPRHLSGADASIAQSTAGAAWTEWAQTPENDVDLITRLRSFAVVEEAVGVARAEAQQIIENRDLSWSPHARAIGNWLDRSEAATRASEQAKEIGVAEKQLKEAIAVIRDERFTPIAEQSIALWEMLRHRSNVQLQAIDLEGANTKRRVELSVTVDGEQSAALGVMSQGELHGLALSLFLPRATMEESPFRFVMIDDPVQSMDPARVDGLARVLEQVSKTHQVVVFTHDDRLPESVRRLQIPAEVLEVTRQPNSQVSTRAVHGPVETAIDDARAIAYTDSMHEVARRKVVPAYCRLAVEAGATTAVRRKRIARGEDASAVEKLLSGATGDLRKLMALAIFDNANRRDDVNDALGQVGPVDAKWALNACNAGAHGDFDGDPKQLVNRSEQLAKWLMERS